MTRYILAIDPGKMTGMCCFSLEKDQDPVLLWSRELTEDEFATPLRWQLDQFPQTEIVCERFVITTQTGKNAQAPYSLELIGVLKQEMRDRDRKVTAINMQKPADAMNMFPNDVLKKLGYWHKGGKDHANDSIRHALLYMAGPSWAPTALLS